MKEIELPQIYDEQALFDRLTEGVKRSTRNICFLIGSPLSAPTALGGPGVPDVAGVIQLVRNEFEGRELEGLEKAVSQQQNPYQAAFGFLLGRRGPDVANQVIKRAVWLARAPLRQADSRTPYLPTTNTTDDACRLLDEDVFGWHIGPGLDALSALVTEQPERFGKTVLTTNFDPLIESAIAASGGRTFRTVLHRDGDLSHTSGTGTHVVHLHGYWYGADTLHTSRQLNQPRPRLKSSISRIIGQSTVVICGYGGWDDVFTQALVEAVTDDGAQPEILWTFLNENPTINSHLLEILSPGIDRGRVSMYGGIDANKFLPKLYNSWKLNTIQRAQSRGPTVDEFSSRYLSELSPVGSPKSPVGEINFTGIDRDRPPSVDFYVGRHDDINLIIESDATIVFITGIGGQGKSALAGRCISHRASRDRFDYFIWRDCKEESDRFESQICTLISALSSGKVTAAELSQTDFSDVAKIFVKHLRENRICVVFDNIDHYVDLENRSLSGAPGLLCSAIGSEPLQSRIIFTCRPDIVSASETALSHRLEGLDVKAAAELFVLRDAPSGLPDVTRAHQFTKGHALWLDLLAAQVARNSPKITLDDLLHDVSATDAEIPTATLRSIWNTLKEREKTVLRGLAETVGSTTILQLTDYMSSMINYNQLAKAIRSLRGLNLLVTRSASDGQDVLELHPLVRTFVRTNFAKADRRSFIEAIISVYSSFIRINKLTIDKSPTAEVVGRWLEAAELYIESGDLKAAFDTLEDVRRTVLYRGSSGDFVRLCHLLFNRMDWSKWNEYRFFDGVFSSYIRILADAGNLEYGNDILEKYRETCASKDARYINFCEQISYFHWTNGNFMAAIKWGAEGVELKQVSGVDTNYDCSHNLALAQRDSGAIDLALNFFLKGSTLEVVSRVSEIDFTTSGDYYGNIGRCLQLMGNVSAAETCLIKSAAVIELNAHEMQVSHQAYIRQWLGELLLAKGDLQTAAAFLEASATKWDQIAPPKSDQVRRLIGTIDFSDQEMLSILPDQAERIFLRWVREQPVGKAAH